jgi:glyoxylase-like metal-dependent hydrolase (beta-lactamase superfamily II)
MYVLIGDERALLLDTGATENASEFPLYESVRSLVGDKVLLVVHSHGHRDHRSADIQFQDAEGVTLVGIHKAAMIDALSISQWPEGQGVIDLGNRELIVIPSPGHQEEAISLYDPQTQWLLTGDTVYPGLIYVKNWNDYRDSIARLARFADKHVVSAVMGAHIEATYRQGEYYAVGTEYQPDEAPLPMEPDILSMINAELRQLPKANEIELDRLRVVPMNLMQRMLSNFFRWVNQ